MEDNKTEEVKKQEDNSKIDQQFNQNLKKLVSLFKGENNLNSTKLPNDDLGTVIDELLKDRKKIKIEDFKKKAGNLLDKKVEFDNFLRQKEKELKDAVTNKKKEFIKEMNECFNLIESIDRMSKDYYTSITEIKEETKNIENKPEGDKSV